MTTRTRIPHPIPTEEATMAVVFTDTRFAKASPSLAGERAIVTSSDGTRLPGTVDVVGDSVIVVLEDGTWVRAGDRLEIVVPEPESPAVRVVVNPAAVGAEWESDGTAWSIVVLHGSSTTPRLHVRPRGAESWLSLGAIEKPERFGRTPIDAESMRAYADRFISRDEG